MNTPLNLNWFLTHLTQTEQKVLALLSLGHSSERIADLVGVSHGTIRTHRESLREILGLKGQGREALVAFAILNADVLKSFLPPDVK